MIEGWWDLERVKGIMAQGTTHTISSFRGPWFFMSNFAPCAIELAGIIYPTLEHAYSAMKTEDKEYRKVIAAAVTPGAARWLGRRVKPLRPGWNDMKLEIMEYLLRIKFSQPEFASCLIATSGAELIEGNTWKDYFWGVCDGRGENHLGKLLMKIRAELIAQCA